MDYYAFSTDCRQGDLRKPGRLVRFLKSRGLPFRVASAKQVHGRKIVLTPRLKAAKEFPGVDGFLTDAAEQPVAIFTADCVPIFMSARKGEVVGLLHAGWRGVQKGILSKAVNYVSRHWGIRPHEIVTWAGPHIGPCCFEVQWDVARYFPYSRRPSRDRWRVDLAAELRRQAKQAGARWVRKKPFQGCTMHESRFYSYRRNQTPERQVSVILKRKPS
jgi:YfiH family protein